MPAVLADPIAYADIRSHGGDMMEEVTLIPVTDVNDTLAKLATLGREDEVIVFLTGKGYKGENQVVTAKIREDHPTARLPSGE